MPESTSRRFFSVWRVKWYHWIQLCALLLVVPMDLSSPDAADGFLGFLGALGLLAWFSILGTSKRPVLSISETEITFRSPGPFRSSRLSLSDVVGIKRDWGDSIGVRLKSGKVVAVSLTAVAPSEQATARAAILAFVDRAAAP